MSKEKKRTSKYCVAAGCTSSNADNISVHKFLKEIKRELRRKEFILIKQRVKTSISHRDFRIYVNLNSHQIATQLNTELNSR